jgi:hypothetical protein
MKWMQTSQALKIEHKQIWKHTHLTVRLFFLRQKHRIFIQERTCGDTEAWHAFCVEGINLSSEQMMQQSGSSFRHVNTAMAQSKFYFGVLWVMTLSILAGLCQCVGGTYCLLLKYRHSHLKVLCGIPNRLHSFTGYLHHKRESLLHGSLVERISNAAT